jgi:hypothetical protein
MPLVCVNSSGWSAKQLGLDTPTLTVMRKRKLIKPQKEPDRRAIRGLRTTHLLLLSQGYDPDVATMIPYRRVLRDLHYRYETLTALSHDARARIIEDVTGRAFGVGRKDETKISNGLFCACLAHYFEAERVVLAGFSLEDGLSYVATPHERFHVKPDSEAIEQMITRGLPLCTSEPALARATDLPLIEAVG